jgi:PleD family two-component response regulator
MNGATAPPTTVDERAQHPAPDDGAATILVCDDDPSLRELVRAVLGPRYRFVEAADGA